MNILVPVVAVSPLRQRLIDEMEIRRFGRETHAARAQAAGGVEPGGGRAVTFRYKIP